MYPELKAYHQANMRDPEEDAGVLAVLQPPRQIQRKMPSLVADTSGRGLMLAPASEQNIHGSFLVRRRDVLLFGPNHLIGLDGTWSCEARANKRQFLWYLHEEFYDRMYPGPKPKLDYQGWWLRCDTDHLTETDVTWVETPVFLATALEPPIWGRWIATVAPKALDFLEHGAGRKFFCYAGLPWQQKFLSTLGIGPDRLMQHDPGRTYICRDVMTVEYSETNMTINARERTQFFELAARHRGRTGYGDKLFVSRLSRSRENPYYRVLQNELEFAGMLAEYFGFDMIEPEFLPFEQQIAAFAGASQIVCVGGSGLFNVAFCAPGTSVVSVESSETYIGAHAEMMASLDLRHGVIFGTEDMTDPGPWHRRWTLDVAQAKLALTAFLESAAAGVTT